MADHLGEDGVDDNPWMASSRTLAGPSGPVWSTRLVTLGVWAVLAFSLAYWVLQWQSAGASDAARPVSPAGDALPVAPEAVALGPALGAQASPADRATAPTLPSRLNLLGVVRAGSRDGAALIAIDGKPPRPVRLGGEVEPGLYLVALEPRRVSLGAGPRGPETLQLELPRPKMP